MKDFGKKIKELRDEKGYSQAKLAEIADISAAEVCRIEKGNRKNPSMELVKSLAIALDLDEEEFVKIIGYNEVSK